MKNIWMMEELIESFTLLPEELHMVLSKSKDARLGFAILFKYFQYECQFPKYKSQFPKQVIQYIAKQIDTEEYTLENYTLNERRVRHHKMQIRNYFGFRLPNNDDSEKVTNWLLSLIDFNIANKDSLKEHIFSYFRNEKIEPPSNERIERIINSVLSTFENKFFNNIFRKLSSESLDGIDSLITSLSDESNEENLFNELRSGPGQLGLETIFLEIKKLRTIRSLNIPGNIFDNISKKVLQKYKQRVGSEDIRELRRHPEPIRYTLLSIFFWLRSREITDNLIELLVQIIHKIKVRAERRIDKEFINDFKCVNGKTNILYKMAEAALANPDEKVKDIIFPIITEKTLTDLVKEFRHSGSAYNKKVHTVMRASYGRHYRRMIPQLLHSLEFKSNNETHRPVMEALELIKKYAPTSLHHFPANEYVPIEGVIHAKWKDYIVEVDDRGKSRINGINYEIFTLQSLRDKLRCKETWTLGADRYRNPDQDLPADFEINRRENYKALNKPLDARNLISHLQNKMINSLDSLNKDIAKNPKVRITTKGNGWIPISQSEPQAEPQNLMKLKSQITSKWPTTNLSDVLKETDLQLSFTDNFKTMGVREQLNRRIIQKRLILALYGLGTNTGLKRVALGNHGEKYKDLLYIRRKFINKDNLRNAISNVVNAILDIRAKEIWGEATTSCASDFKKFASWDQNLMTEWHIRYRGRGVMIYWHVEKNSTCIYSQLKSCSSSEVSSMIEGLLRHCTDMEIEKNYVDTHGQSEIAFAFCYLIGFKLMPRIKSIGRQKLYKPNTTNMNDSFENLTPILTRPINWELIRQQYDQMIKYATALRLGVAETEAILKRFTRNNLKHPTYQALSELGKVIKTIFLCEYLNSEDIRIEIHKGLNVVENWNSANSFIFFGKGGEISTNRLEDQEISVLALHLLQNCMIYINTLMVYLT